MVRPCVARGFVDLVVSGLASMYPASDWSSLCSWPSWISARLRPHYRTDLERASWVTSVRMRREDRTSISFSSSRRPRREGITATSSRAPHLRSSFVRAESRSFVPACAFVDAPRAGAVKAGRRDDLSSCSGDARLRLDRPEHGARIKRAGRAHHRSSSSRSSGHGRERSRRCGRACWRAQSRARCGAAASWRPRSMA